MPTLPSYSDLLQIRPEVLDDQQLLDMINLAELVSEPVAPGGGKRRSLASLVPGHEIIRSPEAFFAITFPTEEVRQTLYALSARASSPVSVPGVILLSSHYGSGKSHVLAAAHHALTAPEVGARARVRPVGS